MFGFCAKNKFFFFFDPISYSLGVLRPLSTAENIIQSHGIPGGTYTALWSPMKQSLSWCSF